MYGLLTRMLNPAGFLLWGLKPSKPSTVNVLVYCWVFTGYLSSTGLLSGGHWVLYPWLLRHRWQTAPLLQTRWHFTYAYTVSYIPNSYYAYSSSEKFLPQHLHTLVTGCHHIINHQQANRHLRSTQELTVMGDGTTTLIYNLLYCMHTNRIQNNLTV